MKLYSRRGKIEIIILVEKRKFNLLYEIYLHLLATFVLDISILKHVSCVFISLVKYNLFHTMIIFFCTTRLVENYLSSVSSSIREKHTINITYMKITEEKLNKYIFVDFFLVFISFYN